jgi:hypothetical protein
MNRILEIFIYFLVMQFVHRNIQFIIDCLFYFNLGKSLLKVRKLNDPSSRMRIVGTKLFISFMLGRKERLGDV